MWESIISLILLMDTREWSIRLKNIVKETDSDLKVNSKSYFSLFVIGMHIEK